MGTEVNAELPNLPPNFWHQVEIQQACRERHFGRLLRSYRQLQRPTLKQGELAHLLQITQGQISRIETNPIPPSDLAKLGQWARALKIPQDILWFDLNDTRDNQSDTPTDASATLSPYEETEDEDVRRRELLKSAGIGAALLGTSSLDIDTDLTSVPNTAVGMESIEIMQLCTQTFRRIDNSYGGGHSLPRIGQYLRAEVIPALQANSHTEKIRKALYSAAAEIYQLAGWSSYDTGDIERGRKSLSQALRLCQDSSNHSYAAELLAGMSHQASFLRKAQEAIDLALAAKGYAEKAGMPALVSEAAVMAAHGYAIQQDKRNSLAQLQEAEAEFCRIRPEDSPTWLSYFDEAYLSAKFGHVLKDLGIPSEAERFARRSLQMSDGYERGRIFNTALLASTLADQGQITEAITNGSLALQMTKNVKSARTVKYLADVAYRLMPYKSSSDVQTLHKSMTQRGIPLQAA